MKLVPIKIPRNIFFFFLSLPVVAGIAALLLFARNINNRLQKMETSFEEVRAIQENINQNLPEELFQDHLTFTESVALGNKLKELELELEGLSTSKANTLLTNINKTYALYQEYQKKLTRNAQVKLSTDGAKQNIEAWGKLLMDQQFDSLATSVSEQIKVLDNDFEKYLATLPPPAPPAGGGYSYISVNTERGKFGMYLIKVSKSSVTVKTIAAIENDCKRDCPTKSLQQYVQENNAYAGITGSYACPADYAQCAEKKWSFDFALYDSNDKKWLNKGARSWNETGMYTFSGRSSRFYDDSSDYDGDGVTAAISNYPSLLKGGNVVVDSDDIDSYQKVKGLRGVMGTDDDNIYLAYITGASVIDAAYAIKAAGAKDALNLDGGGTAAMYINGGYVVGPGRPLANAVLLIK